MAIIQGWGDLPPPPHTRLESKRVGTNRVNISDILNFPDILVIPNNNLILDILNIPDILDALLPIMTLLIFWKN